MKFILRIEGQNIPKTWLTSYSWLFDDMTFEEFESLIKRLAKEIHVESPLRPSLGPDPRRENL